MNGAVAMFAFKLSEILPIKQTLRQAAVINCSYLSVSKYPGRKTLCTLITNKTVSKASTVRRVHEKFSNSNDHFHYSISELLDHLELEIKNFERIKLEDGKALLHFIEKGHDKEHENYALLLLDWCGHMLPDVKASSRVAFAHSVWEVLRGLDIKMQAKHYNALLKCYAANNHAVFVTQFLNEMGDIEPDNSTYELLLECCCGLGDTNQAVEVIQMMKDKRITINENIFNTLILGHARAGDIKSSLSTLNFMIASNLEPTAKTYLALLQSYAEIGDIENLKRIYEEVTEKNIHLSTLQLMSICRILAQKGHTKIIPEFLAILPDTLKKFTLPFQNMVIELIHSKHTDGALSVMKWVLKDDPSSEQSWTLFTTEICRANTDPVDVVNICCDLKKNDICPRILYHAAEASLGLAKVELTLKIFEALHVNNEILRPHFFWPLFRQRAATLGQPGVLSTLKDMQEFGIKPDFHTLTDYVIPWITSSDPVTSVEKLNAFGISVRECLTPVAATFLQKGNFQSVLHLCESYSTKLDFEKLLPFLVEAFLRNKSVKHTTLILKRLQQFTSDDLAGHFILELLAAKRSRYNEDDIINFLQSFKATELFISSFACEVLVQYFRNGSLNSSTSHEEVALLKSITQSDLHISSVESAAHIIHPRDMNIEELECHLIELKSKSMNTRGVLRRLLQSHIREKNVKRVLEIKQELEDSGFQFSPGMLASIFALYIQVKDTISAEKSLNQLMQYAPEFVVDEHKIIDYATLLILDNQYKAAVAVLERQAASHPVSGGEKISRNCWQLLNSLAAQGEPEKVKHMLHLLHTLGYCSITNVLLGPLIRAYIVRGDATGAVREYKNCTSQFQKTPLQQEFLQHLIERGSDSLDYQELLDETLKATASVHGEPNTFTTYIVALAESGKKKELHKFISENGYNIHYSNLVNRAKRLAKENKLSSLSLLADACGSLPNFDTTTIYHFMLQICDKQGDCDGAVKLWMNMQEKNIQPTSKFLESLSSLLRSHNRTIPFTVPNLEQ